MRLWDGYWRLEENGRGGSRRHGRARGRASVPLSSWATRKVHVHGFAALPATRGTKVTSPEFSSFGHKWTVAVYPGGYDGSEEGYVAVEHPSTNKILVKHPTDPIQKAIGIKSGDEMATFEAKGVPRLRGGSVILPRGNHC